MQLNDWCEEEQCSQIPPVYTFAFCLLLPTMIILFCLLVEIITSVTEKLWIVSYLLRRYCICFYAVYTKICFEVICPYIISDSTFKFRSSS